MRETGRDAGEVDAECVDELRGFSSGVRGSALYGIRSRRLRMPDNGFFPSRFGARRMFATSSVGLDLPHTLPVLSVF